jgi:hypothetical protein
MPQATKKAMGQTSLSRDRQPSWLINSFSGYFGNRGFLPRMLVYICDAAKDQGKIFQAISNP